MRSHRYIGALADAQHTGFKGGPRQNTPESRGILFRGILPRRSVLGDVAACVLGALHKRCERTLYREVINPQRSRHGFMGNMPRVHV